MSASLTWPITPSEKSVAMRSAQNYAEAVMVPESKGEG
ncbi:hypothetical protein C8D77_102886 [Mesorhizobium loti]|uniref:Uncharacterized protein n=1 Tax=Rhizobium loti TaxID=381 RepID=A0A8E2WFY3_RHILI|nr:hypothetical protein C8D77_102886 [Mesorhizobium loti]